MIARWRLQVIAELGVGTRMRADDSAEDQELARFAAALREGA